MSTIALVGGDGSGKTTIARLLEKTLPWPGRYLYMGTSVISSDAALPTTKLARALKLHLRKLAGAPGEARPGGASMDELHYGDEKRGVIWVAARFLNRMAEAWWRQLLSLIYQTLGYIVIFDRHFLFQSEDGNNSRVSHLFERMEHRLLDRFYPEPDLVIFLDAPPEVLCSRKCDTTGERLDEQRETILRHGKMVKNFVVIDASRPLLAVLEDVRERIILFHAAVKCGGRRANGRTTG